MLIRNSLLGAIAIGALVAGTALAQEPGNDPSVEQAPTTTAPMDDGMDGTTSEPQSELPSSEPDPSAQDDATQDDAAQDASASTYVVKEGDTLSAIAEEKLGNPAEWKKLASLNRIDDPTKLAVGTELKVPATSENSDSRNSIF